MKKLSYILFVLLMVSTYSCKKGDLNKSINNAAAVEQPSIIGKWTITNMTVTLTHKDSKISNNTAKPTESSAAKQQWEFKSDGNLYIQNGLSALIIPYQRPNAGKIILSYKNVPDTLDVTIKLNKVLFTENKILANGKTSITTLELGRN